MGVKLIKSVDSMLGKPLCIALGLFGKKSKIVPFQNILIIQLWGIGETILTLPSIKALHQLYPHSMITVLCTERNKAVYEGQKSISQVKTVGINVFSLLHFLLKNYQQFDLVIDFEEYLNISAIMGLFVGTYRVGYAGQTRSRLYDRKISYHDQQHVVETHLDLVRLLGIKYHVTNLVPLCYGRKDKEQVQELWKNNQLHGKVIAVAPGAAESSKSRMWPLSSWISLCRKTLDENPKLHILLIGDEQEKTICSTIKKQAGSKNIVNLAGATSLKQLFCLLSKVDVVIGNDSGPMHISAAMGTKTIGLFGPNLPIRWRPFGEGNIALYKGNICPFSPCINVHKGQVPECLQPRHNNICMQNITVEEVYDAVKKIL